jgi:hypothetical protein
MDSGIPVADTRPGGITMKLSKPIRYATLALVVLAPALVAQGKFSVRRPAALQASCQSFRALSPQTFDASVGGYVGPTFAVLGSEVLIDAGAPRPPLQPPTTECSGSMCVDLSAQYLYDFGNGDTLILAIQAAAYEEPPTFGTYRAVNKVVGGTGRFKEAFGTLVEFGPYVAWIDSKGELQARYNGELSGTLCNVAPKKKP